MADLPIVPPNGFKLVPRDAKSKKQLKLVETLLKRDDVDQVVNACDAGREGELIFAYLYESVFGTPPTSPDAPKPVERLWISSMTKQAIRDGFDQLRPGDAAAAARVGRPRALRGRLARRHERDPRRDDPRPRLGRRRRLARPRPDADARDHRSARARDPGVRPRAVLARPRDFDPRYEGLWFDPIKADDKDTPTGQETWLKEAERAEEIVDEGLRQDRHRRVGRAQGAVRARAAPLRPHVAAARRELSLRLLRAADAPGRPVALRGQEGDHLSAHELPLPLRRPRPAAQADRRDARRRFPSTRPRRASCSGSNRSRSARVVNDAQVDDHHAIIPTDVEHDVSEFSPDERRIFDLVARASWPSSIRRPAMRGRRSSPSSRTSASAPAARSRSRPAGAASTGSRPMADKPTRRTPRAPSSRRSRRVSRSRSSPPRARRRRRGPPAALHRGDAALRDGDRGQAHRRRGAARGDEGARPRHPGDARRDDRDADPARVHRARRQGSHADAEGPPGDHDARGEQADLAGADRRLGEAARRHRARQGREGRLHQGHRGVHRARRSRRSRRSTRRSSGPSGSSSASARAAAPRRARSSARTRRPTAARAGSPARRRAAGS